MAGNRSFFRFGHVLAGLAVVAIAAGCGEGVGPTPPEQPQLAQGGTHIPLPKNPGQCYIPPGPKNLSDCHFELFWYLMGNGLVCRFPDGTLNPNDPEQKLKIEITCPDPDHPGQELTCVVWIPDLCSGDTLNIWVTDCLGRQWFLSSGGIPIGQSKCGDYTVS